MWTPDETPPDVRCAGLSKAELRWLDRADDDRPRRSPSHLVRKASERIQTGSAQAAAALINATVAVPPQQRSTAGARRGSDVPDPALAQIEATVRAVDHGLSSSATCSTTAPRAATGSAATTTGGRSPWRR